MYKLFITDFIKNKIILLLSVGAVLAELLLTQSIHTSLLLFCLPYSLSVLLNYLMNYRPLKKPSPRISAQFRPQRLTKIKITPK
ncbi:hypothetical protein [Legionella sp. km772]|uniref:hypothetical protein n=1 Tax=Legionella sp. km772 TaxID=2498111 RepID=UPI000F8DEF6B|nr:hypothetical protein [Legionella sp. km772]RUR12409.1 hypothetical protein ELY15_05135 [Legionella sp. km772]